MELRMKNGEVIHCVSSFSTVKKWASCSFVELAKYNSFSQDTL